MSAGGGPRAMASAFGIGNWSGVNLPSGSAFPAPSTTQEMNASKSAVADFDALNREGTDPDATAFNRSTQNELDVLTKHPELLPQITRSYNESGTIGQGWDKYVHHVLGGVPTNYQVAQSNTMARLFLADAAKLRDMKSGKIKGTQADMDALQERLSSEAMWTGDANGNVGKISGGDYSGLPDMSDENAVRQWMLQNVDYQRNTQSAGEWGWYNFKSLGGAIQTNDTPTPLINPVLNPLPTGKAAPVQGPPAPTTRPTTQPVSINYHILCENPSNGIALIVGLVFGLFFGLDAWRGSADGIAFKDSVRSRDFKWAATVAVATILDRTKEETAADQKSVGIKGSPARPSASTGAQMQREKKR